MPVYQFRCPAGHVTEIHRAAEDSGRDAVCDTCGQPARRQFRLGGIAFHGPGFHNTDHPSSRRRLRG